MLRSLYCVHLLDDLSGAAKVFASAVGVLQQAGHTTHVVVGSHGSGGFIRQRHAVETVIYRFQANRLLLLASFAMVQWRLFLHVRRGLRAGHADGVYVNTVLPVGAMLAARLCRRPVVTHIHEVGLGTRVLFSVLLAGTLRWSSRLVGVSDYVVRALALPPDRTTVIHNSLEPAEWARATQIVAERLSSHPSAPFRVLMACSLKTYKGINEFFALARACGTSSVPALRRVTFTLLLNCESDELRAFRAQLHPHDRVEIVHRPSSVYDHYARAHLVLNLSLPEAWVETFGLTLLEAMACGVPVIGPVVGGCTELFEPGQGGWSIGARDVPALLNRIEKLAGDAGTWQAASAAAQKAAGRFSPVLFAQRLTELFDRL